MQPEAPAAMPDTSTLFDDAGRLSVSLLCVNCGYNLRTLARDGACPECGTAVADSVKTTHIQLASAARLSRAALGVQMLFFAIVLWLGGFGTLCTIGVAVAFAGSMIGFAAGAGVLAISYALLVIGAAITSNGRRFSQSPQQRSATIRIRWALFAFVVLIGLAISRGGVGDTFAALAWLLQSWLWKALAQYVVCFLCHGERQFVNLSAVASAFRASLLTAFLAILMAFALAINRVPEKLIMAILVLACVAGFIALLYFQVLLIEAGRAFRYCASLLRSFAAEARKREKLGANV